MSRYQPFYCEENVWWILRDLAERRVVPASSAPAPAGASPPERSDAYAVFITNRTRAVAVWEQRLAPPGEPVIWDYHVIAVIGGRAWDLDSRLGAPAPLGRYLTHSFRPLPAEAHPLAPVFRVVPASTFLARFSTDRSHMRTAEGWRAPPPDWAPPRPPTKVGGIASMTLPRFLDLDDPIGGDVVDLAGLCRRFGLSPTPPVA